MFKHEKLLFHPVEIEKPNPQYAALLQEQLGGGNGELKAAMQYLSQSFRIKDPTIKDLFLDIAAEEAGNTVLVIEHNLDVIKTADHIIDLGPEGGDQGGYVVAQGTPEQVAAVPGSYTGQYLKRVL